MMMFVLYAYLTHIAPDTMTDLAKGLLHFGFVIGYVLFLISDGKD